MSAGHPSDKHLVSDFLVFLIAGTSGLIFLLCINRLENNDLFELLVRILYYRARNNSTLVDIPNHVREPKPKDIEIITD